MFDISGLEWPPPPVIPPPEDVILIDDLLEDQSGVAEPVRWSEYLPDGPPDIPITPNHHHH